MCSTCSMPSIDILRLEGVVPEVFASDTTHVGGDVWLTDLVLERGRTYRVEAASGRGKSSLCAYLYGLRADYRGHIYIGGRDAATLTVADWCALRRRHLAYVPQGLDLFADLSALDNVLIKNRLTGFRTEAGIRADFDRLGLGGLADRPAGRLSVGQQQRVAIIRALCQPFDFILLDEPVSHLDEANNRLCAALVAECAAAQGAAVVATSVGNPLAVTGDVMTLAL